jgi:hypothetical protein
MLNNHSLTNGLYDVREIKNMSDIQLLSALSYSQESSKLPYLQAELKRRQNKIKKKRFEVL